MSEVPPLYKDIGKKARDLVSKNFPDSFNVEVNHSQPLDVKLSTFQRSKGASSFEVEASQNFNAPYLNLPTKVTVFTDSLEKFHIEEQVEDLLVPGSKLTYRLTSKDGAFENKFSSEYKRNFVSFSSSATLAGKNTANASLAVGKKEGLVAGGEGELAVATRQLSSSAVGASYVLKDFEVSGFVKNGKSRTYVLSLWSVLPNVGATFATELTYDPASTVAARVALEKKIFPDVTGKVRWDNKNILSLSFVTKLNKSTELTFAEELDFENAKISKIGFTLAFK